MDSDLFLARIVENAKKYKKRSAYRVFREGKWQEVSWEQFLINISRNASAMLKNGINPGDRVALYAANCPEWTEADFACLAVQAVSVAVHSTSSAADVGHIIEETEPKLVFVGNSKLADCILETQKPEKIVILEGTHPQCVTLKEFLDVPLDPNWRERFDSTKPDDLWTIVYTSGTTGEVRGAMLTHHNIIHQINAHLSRLPNLSDKDASFCLLPLSHIFERGWTYIQYAWGMTHHYCVITPDAIKLLSTAKPSIICVVPRIMEKIYAAIQDNFAQKPLNMQGIIASCIKNAKEYQQKLEDGVTPSLALKAKNMVADMLVCKKIRKIFGGRLKHCVVGSASLDRDIHTFFRACGIFINSGYGLTETTATLSSTIVGSSIPGTVGLPMDGMELRLGENDEIQVKGPSVMKGYYKKEQATKEVFTEDGFFRTGDVGKIGPKGYLCITDRIKDLIRTSTGKYIAPQFLEARMALSPYIEQAAIVGEGRSWVGALLVPNFEKLETYAKKIGLSFTSRDELVTCPEIVNFVKNAVDELLQDVARHEKVQRIALLVKPFTIQAGELTPTLKLRRKVILEHYKDIIQAMDSWVQSTPHINPASQLVNAAV